MFASEGVFYGTVSGFKGLERTCVVLAVNGFSAQARAKQMLYVGLSRARSQLVVVGDLDEIAPPGDRGGVRKRLQAAGLAAAGAVLTPWWFSVAQSALPSVPYDEDLADRLRLLLRGDNLTEMKVFGGLAFLLHAIWPSP